MDFNEFVSGFGNKTKVTAKKGAAKYHAARNAHETRTIVRNTQKASVLSSRANVEEQKERIAKAKRNRRAGRKGISIDFKKARGF